MTTTEHRNYPLPVPDHNVSDDVLLLIQALEAVDGDIDALLMALSGKAAASHSHQITDISGLQNALNGLAAANHQHSLDDLSNVDGAGSAATGYVLVKGSNGVWSPVAPSAITGNHEHTIEQVQGLAEALAAKLAASALGTAAEFRSAATGKVLTADQVWAAASIVALTDASTIAFNMAAAVNASVTLGGNRTLGQPTNVKAGQSGCILIRQDATGSRTLSFHSSWLFVNGQDPTLSTTPNAYDLLYYFAVSDTFIHASLNKAIS